jgi:hypothetical protein
MDAITEKLRIFLAGWIDTRPQDVQMFGMKLKNTISTWLNVFACVAFAFALVIFPASAAHAASGMHRDHHVVSSSAEHDMMGHEVVEIVTVPTSGQCSTVSTTWDKEASSTQCCSGICLSVVLTEDVTFFVEQALSGKYLTRNAQTSSTDPSSFLRPPRYLI